MKLLETTLTNLAVSGFRRNQTHLFNMNHLISMFAFISHLAFFFYEAENLVEYVNSAYFTTTTLGIFISFTHSIYKAPAIFTLVDNAQKLVDKRECNENNYYQVYIYLLSSHEYHFAQRFF